MRLWREFELVYLVDSREPHAECNNMQHNNDDHAGGHYRAKVQVTFGRRKTYDIWKNNEDAYWFKIILRLKCKLKPIYVSSPRFKTKAAMRVFYALIKTYMCWFLIIDRLAS
ncbi:uncharacterized protein LOC126846549 [Adelges cooleyi]|uniref:uncharacterized protein LOC126846549 n=1 Tax=Adelges cooleyi TaxID=133065 RepID=UPI00217F68FB|nr:uncharacterized protein LOC126846549 [Adelges cooleyi]